MCDECGFDDWFNDYTYDLGWHWVCNNCGHRSYNDPEEDLQ